MKTKQMKERQQNTALDSILETQTDMQMTGKIVATKDVLKQSGMKIV